MIEIVVTDLDNTIYNWVDFYVPSYLALVAELSALTGIGEEALKASFKRLHEHYRTTEYSFAVHELDVLSKLNDGLSARQVYEKYSPAIRAFRKRRMETLHLYDGVREALSTLRKNGKKTVAHTDSLLFHATQRLKRLGVEELYDAIVAPPDHGFPSGVKPSDIRYYEDTDAYTSRIPIQITLENGLRKPDPMSLRSVLTRFGVEPAQAVYVGDGLFRDVLMAQRCGVYDVHAKYGQVVDPRNYEELLKITYWTQADVAAEQELRKTPVTPSFEIQSFPELLQIIDVLDRESSTPSHPSEFLKVQQ